MGVIGKVVVVVVDTGLLVVGGLTPLVALGADAHPATSTATVTSIPHRSRLGATAARRP
jgi:hypothetical protein